MSGHFVEIDLALLEAENLASIQLFLAKPNHANQTSLNNMLRKLPKSRLQKFLATYGVNVETTWNYSHGHPSSIGFSFVVHHILVPNFTFHLKFGIKMWWTTKKTYPTGMTVTLLQNSKWAAEQSLTSLSCALWEFEDSSICTDILCQIRADPISW